MILEGLEAHIDVRLLSNMALDLRYSSDGSGLGEDERRVLAGKGSGLGGISG